MAGHFIDPTEYSGYQARSNMRRAKITGIGHAVPKRVVTNADLEELMDTSDEWITERSGI